jgi:signal peptidase II
MRHALLFFGLALSGAGLDLLTKHLVFGRLEEYQEVTVLPGVLEFGRTLNRGVIFGKFSGADKLWLGVSILAVPVILWIFFSVKKPQKWILTISLGLILAGTLGNMFDRVSQGAVRDFIKFHWKGHVWPLFNLADSFICVGVFLLSIEMLFFDEKKRSARASATGADSPQALRPAGETPPAGALPGPGSAMEGK